MKFYKIEILTTK